MLTATVFAMLVFATSSAVVRADPQEAQPMYDEPDYECYHEDYEADVNGRATCCCCGETWWLSSQEIAAERQLHAAYDRMVRRWEREQWIEGWVHRLAFWRRWRKPKPEPICDDVPF